ncbi:MAG: hypothetical protein KF771_06440 [Burkholderiales bacterium]|nr:hypothetical protein [Burkholderiales bacterium]
MKRAMPPAAFGGAMAALAAAGLFSALIDGTLGWEYLVREMLRQLVP